MLDEVILEGDNAPKFRRGPKVWGRVFDLACQSPCYSKRGFGYTEIHEIAKEANIDVSREGIRIKLDRYRKQGYVKKIARGRFWIMPKGYYFFWVTDKPVEASI